MAESTTIFVAASEWAMQIPAEAFRLIVSHACSNLERVPDQTAAERIALDWAIKLACKKELI